MDAKAPRKALHIRLATALMVGGTGVIVFGCIGALLWVLQISTASVDATAVTGESRLLDFVMDTYQSELSKTVVDYATWDELFNNFAQKRNEKWETANLGPSITKQLGADYVAVMSKKGAVAYFYSKEREGEVEPTAADRKTLTAISQQTFLKKPSREGASVLGSLMIDGFPGLVAATPIVASDHRTPGYVLIEIRTLNNNLLAKIAKGFGVGSLQATEWNGTGLALAPAVHGVRGVSLTWTSSREGHRLFVRTMPAVVLTGVMLFLVFFALMALWWAIVERIQLSEARALNAEVDAARARAAVAEETARNKNAFIANMNHELRTPLNAIIGFSEIIQAEALGPLNNSKYREYIKDINDSGQHLLGIINDILLVSKVDAGKFVPRLEPVRFGEVLGETVRMMEIIASKRNIWINTFRCTDDAVVEADRQALRQVLLNVISNAVKFSPENGGIDLETEAKDDGTFEVRVIDYGCGIPPETLKDLGKPFVQAEMAFARNYQGTGLGLSICYRLVAAMGGTIVVESQVKAGTKVTIILKAAPTANEASPAEQVA